MSERLLRTAAGYKLLDNTQSPAVLLQGLNFFQMLLMEQEK